MHTPCPVRRGAAQRTQFAERMALILVRPTGRFRTREPANLISGPPRPAQIGFRISQWYFDTNIRMAKAQFSY
jgi:hypothetical protein